MHRRKENDLQHLQQHIHAALAARDIQAKEKSGTTQGRNTTFCFYPVTVTSYVGMIQIRYTGPGGLQPALSLLPQTPRYLCSILFTSYTIPLTTPFCQVLRCCSRIVPNLLLLFTPACPANKAYRHSFDFPFAKIKKRCIIIEKKSNTK